MEKLNTNAKRLLFTHYSRQILQYFYTAFLGIYFLNVGKAPIINVVGFYAIFYLCHIVFFYLIYKFVRAKDVIPYRIGLFMMLMSCTLLLVLGGGIVKYIYPFAVFQGLTNSMYYTSYKTITVANNRDGGFRGYFSASRIIQYVLNVIVPLVMGKLLSLEIYTMIFIFLLMAMISSFISSFFIKSSGRFDSHFSLMEAKKNVRDWKDLRRIWRMSICAGLTSEGTSTLLLSLIIFLNHYGTDTLGYLTAAVSIMGILITLFHNNKVKKADFLITYMPACVLTMIIAVPLSFSNKLIILVVYKFLEQALITAGGIERDQLDYNMIGHVVPKKYQREYLYSIEFTLNVGRLIGMGLIAASILINQSKLGILFIIVTSVYVIIFLTINMLIMAQDRIEKAKLLGDK